ncbi:hypothetical protein [Flavobacterium cellulosilyticum]|uniref:Prenyltransferase n=1 Tax=Flavobacterium cellulosilyticum TaxID=2541731 RepID=A0A4R5C777_9FLAO|nr:hypothetical protein [Flavobacterium cellulosilyticum]TDD95578.1 hypothetical protein E0F76_14050 [Flavobacterium cellulosilyticum]
MKSLKTLLDFYINSSIHVALSVYALVRMTDYMFQIPNDKPMAYFAFFGTIVGYNFVKYDALVRLKKLQMRSSLKAIIFISVFSFLVVGYYFFQLQRITQIISVLFLALTLLYTLPFFPNRKNARNWAGIKIYIVALCWVGVTLVLPILDSGIAITTDFYLKCIQRFILVFVLILIFEIIDLANDDPHLQTVPQQIGVKLTKTLGYFLMVVFCVLELFVSNVNFKINFQFFYLIFAIAIGIAILLAYANQKRSKYYTSFWVESVPIIWWLMVVWLNK